MAGLAYSYGHPAPTAPPHTGTGSGAAEGLSIGSQTTGWVSTEAPGGPALLWIQRLMRKGPGASRPQSGPGFTQHHASTELKTS